MRTWKIQNHVARSNINVLGLQRLRTFTSQSVVTDTHTSNQDALTRGFHLTWYFCFQQSPRGMKEHRFKENYTNSSFTNYNLLFKPSWIKHSRLFRFRITPESINDLNICRNPLVGDRSVQMSVRRTTEHRGRRTHPHIQAPGGILTSVSLWPLWMICSPNICSRGEMGETCNTQSGSENT
jgi:hypothetical protein